MDEMAEKTLKAILEHEEERGEFFTDMPRLEEVGEYWRIHIGDRRIYVWIFEDKQTVYADVKELMDKPSNAPIRLPIPQNDAQMEYLLESLRWLDTEEARHISNHLESEKRRFEYPVR